MRQVSKPTHRDTSSSEAPFSPVVRIVARIISFVFHPLFIPVYLFWFLIYINPLFSAFDAERKKLLLMISCFLMYTFFPLLTVLLLKGLGFIESIYLKTQRDRIIPYIASGFYYFWMWYVLKNRPDYPAHLVMLSLAIFLGSSIGLIVNSFIKVSMHTIAAGVMTAFMITFAFTTDANFGFYISVSLFLTGLIATARLINNDHHPFEVYCGLFIGIIAQLAAYWTTGAK